MDSAMRELADPVPSAIAKSETIVAAVPFLQAPRTFDPPSQRPTGGAREDPHARIQYLQPVPDGGGRLAFNDTRGLLWVTDRAGGPPSLYLDLRRRRPDFLNTIPLRDNGFMGFAFHPDFAHRGRPGYGRLYTAFTAKPRSGGADHRIEGEVRCEAVIVEWTAAASEANVFSGTARELFRVQMRHCWHSIGTIAFNPTANGGQADYGLLYVGLGNGQWGDGCSGAPSPPRGAILRIAPLPVEGGGRYGIPADNPFAQTAGEVWAFGLRHPQQFSWDLDGRMFIADIGQRHVEEVNLGVAGGHYGWPRREGTFARLQLADGCYNHRSLFSLPLRDPQPYLYPIAQYDHDEGKAIGGGFVYRGGQIPELRGKYVFTDIPTGRVFMLNPDAAHPGQAIEELRLAFDGRERALADVASYQGYRHRRVDARISIDHAGELYLLTKGDGWIRKLAPK